MKGAHYPEPVVSNASLPYTLGPELKNKNKTKELNQTVRFFKEYLPLLKRL